MSASDHTIGIDELAQALGRTVAWVKRNHMRLHTNEGFPRRLPGTWVWSRYLVTAWLQSGGASQSTTMGQDQSPVTYAARARTALHARYGITTH